MNDVAKKFYEKGKAYKHYYDASTGFMRGKNYDGSWVKNFDPKHSDHAKSDYVEGNAYQWTPIVPHDAQGLVELKGGKEKMGVWLDSLFTTSSEIKGENASGDITGLIGQYAHGNEPSHHTAYLYHFTDRAWRTSEVIDHILYEFYDNTPEGIIGNEDCGQMSAWYVLNALGFYQIAPGKPEYHLGRPIVDKAEIRVDGGWFTIEVKNNSRTNKYIKSATLNGKKLSELKFLHSDLKANGKLVIEMSANH
jgi:predicted alpha-1,2-mannosidase